jgi:hypothetical protein
MPRKHLRITPLSVSKSGLEHIAGERVSLKQLREFKDYVEGNHSDALETALRDEWQRFMTYCWRG